MSKEMKDEFFLNLLSHPVCRQAGYTQLMLRRSVNLSVLWASYFEPQRQEGHKVH
jgi:hypothetical protein